MKIHGTAKGGALDTKDFGVAFGGGSAYPDGNCVNGTCSNVTVDTDDKPSFADGCYSFNGSSSTIAIGNMLATTVFTISVWFKTNSVGSNQSIFGNTDATNGMNLYLHSTGELRCSEESTGTQLRSSNTFSADTWYNVILTKTADSGSGDAVVTMYVNNGDPPEDTQSNWIDLANGTTSEIGSDQGDYWDGFLADFAVWNVVISSDLRAEINANSGALISSLSDKSGITTYYPMDEIDGSTCKNIAC